MSSLSCCFPCCPVLIRCFLLCYIFSWFVLSYFVPFFLLCYVLSCRDPYLSCCFPCCDLFCPVVFHFILSFSILPCCVPFCTCCPCCHVLSSFVLVCHFLTNVLNCFPILFFFCSFSVVSSVVLSCSWIKWQQSIARQQKSKLSQPLSVVQDDRERERVFGILLYKRGTESFISILI